MYCKYCGNKLNKGDKYCDKCGHKVSEDVDSSINDVNRSDNGSSDIVALILSIVALLSLSVPFVSLVLSIISVVLNSKYKKNTGKDSRGKVIGIVSLVFSIIYIVFIIGIVIIFTFAARNSNNSIFRDIYDDIREYDKDIDNIIDIKNGYFSLSDGTYIEFNPDGNYRRYKNNNDKNDNYYGGTYEVYNGMDAVRYISNLDDLSISEAEQYRKFRDNDIEDYYVIVLNCNYEYVNGERKESNVINYYYGFADDNYLRMQDIETFSNILFRLESNSNSGGNGVV